MGANIAVIYSGDLGRVAEAFGEAGAHLAARVRLLRLPDRDDARSERPFRPPELADLEWADGIAFGTPISDGAPAAELMRFIERTEPLWSSGRLYQKAVTVITDEPEHLAPDSVLHPIYDALYPWGAVIIGPRVSALELAGRPGHGIASHTRLPDARLKATQHRATRLTRLAGVLADDRMRMARLQI